MKLFSTLIVISHVSWAANHLSSCFCTHKHTLSLSLSSQVSDPNLPSPTASIPSLIVLGLPSRADRILSVSFITPQSLPGQEERRLHWKQLSWRLLFTAKPFGGLEIVRAGTLSLSLSVDSADRVMRGEVSKDTSCCESQSDSVSQSAEWLPSARLDSNTQSVSGWDISCSVDVSCHSTLPPLITYSSFPVHLASIQDASVYSHPGVFKLFLSAENGTELCSDDRRDGGRWIVSLMPRSHWQWFCRWRTAGRYWAFLRLDVPMLLVCCTAVNSF